MAPGPLQHGMRPALQGCARTSLFASRTPILRHRALGVRNSRIAGHAVRSFSLWGKKPMSWTFYSFELRTRKYLRRRCIGLRSAKPAAGAADRGADSRRCFSGAKDGNDFNGTGGSDPVDPFLGHPSAFRHRMNSWKQMLERDPYEALFGRSNAMLQGRPWQPFWAPKEDSSNRKQALNPTAPSVDSAESIFVYDPITGRMVMKSVLQQDSSASLQSSQDGVIDIPVKSFKSQKCSPFDALNNALFEYESKAGMKTHSAAAKYIDPVRDSLTDYESNPRNGNRKASVEPIDTLPYALKEYESKSKSAERNSHTQVVDQLNEALKEYETQPKRTVLEASIQSTDPLRDALKEYETQPNQTSSTASPQLADDSLEAALGEYDKKPRLAATKLSTKHAEPLQSALEEYESQTKPVYLQSQPADNLNEALKDYEVRQSQIVTKCQSEPVDPLQESLKEYESQPKKVTKPPFKQTASLEECLNEYEVQRKKSAQYVTPATAVDRLQECLQEYDLKPKKAAPLPATPKPDPLQGELLEYESKRNGMAYAFTSQMQEDLERRFASEKLEKASTAMPTSWSEDMDEIRPSDIRAGIKATKEKHARRERLEREFDDMSKTVDAEITQRPRISQAHLPAASEPILQSTGWKSTGSKDQAAAVESLTAEMQQTSLKPQQTQPIETSLDRLRYSYRDIKKDLAAQKADGGDESGSAAHRPTGKLDQVMAPKLRSKQGQLQAWNGRIDMGVHDALQEYEHKMQNTVYQFSPSNDLEFDTPSHQGSTRSAANHASSSSPSTFRMPEGSQSSTPRQIVESEPESVSALLASNVRSIFCSFEGDPKKLIITTSPFDINGTTRALSTTKALSEFAHPALFFPYLTLLETYNIVQYSRSLLVLQKRPEPSSATPAPPADPHSLPINPIDGTTIPIPEPPVGNFASPTGFVRYEPSMPIYTPGPIPEKTTAKSEPNNKRSERQEQKRGGGGAASVFKTAIWAGTACYIAGVAGELAKQQH